MRAFNEITYTEITANWVDEITKAVNRQSKEYILGVDELTYQQHLIEKYILDPVVVEFDKEQIGEPLKKKETKSDQFYGERYDVEVYYFTITYPYSGSDQIFRIRPNPWSMIDYEILVNEHRGTVAFTFSISKLDSQEFNRLKEDAKRSAFTNLVNANTNAQQWNSQVAGHVQFAFQKRKGALMMENDFFAAINLKVNKENDGLFSVPITPKKITPQPQLDKKQTFSNMPAMAQETYVHVLQLLNDVGRGMERKPSMYKGKDENGLRDIFLSQLEFRYDGITASGETFNASGKTDIILKYAPDGSNVFVAECKFWTGAAGFLDTITQLFDRYLTWRDSKVAVMMFVKTNDFSGVLNNMRTEIRNHPYYLRPNGQRSDSSFSYIFRLKQDPAKEVLLEAMAFHFHQI
jgi:hypothetical protein